MKNDERSLATEEYLNSALDDVEEMHEYLQEEYLIDLFYSTNMENFNLVDANDVVVANLSLLTSNNESFDASPFKNNIIIGKRLNVKIGEDFVGPFHVTNDLSISPVLFNEAGEMNIYFPKANK